MNELDLIRSFRADVPGPSAAATAAADEAWRRTTRRSVARWGPAYGGRRRRRRRRGGADPPVRRRRPARRPVRQGRAESALAISVHPATSGGSVVIRRPTGLHGVAVDASGCERAPNGGAGRRPARVAAALVVTGVLAVAPQATADFSSSDYSQSSSACNNRVDPVTVVFLGFGAYAETYGHSHRTYDLINGMPDSQHDWRVTGAGTQWASSHSVCTTMERTSMTSSDAPRYHVRLNQTHHPDLNGRYETVGTPHYEVNTGCGHAVPPDSQTSGNGSGFVLGRGHLKNDWLSAYGSGKLFRTDNWGNTALMRQATAGTQRTPTASSTG